MDQARKLSAMLIRDSDNFGIESSDWIPMTCIRDLVDPAGIATEIYSAAAALLGKSIKSNAGADTTLRSRSHNHNRCYSS